MDRWQQYLFREHSEAELRDWASRLRLFRYFRAYGGHANDADSLDVAFRYQGEAELVRLLGRWAIPVKVFHEKPPQAIPGEPYCPEDFSAFPRLVSGTRWIEQPGHCTLFEKPVFVWCSTDTVKVSASPSSWNVTEDHVRAAEALELEFARWGPFEVVDPPADTNHYVCPKYYPEWDWK
ncbi:MAG TPA: hypothetical protein VI197_07005 [Polyangiaceae bacterium]